MARLDLNVASRPFVNAGPLVMATAVLAGILGVASFANVYTLVRTLAASRTLAAEVAVSRAETDQARKEAKALVERMPEKEKKRVRGVAATSQAIVQKRRLAWTRLFEQLAAVLPRDVRVLSVLPDVHDSHMNLLMEASAKSNEAKLKFYGKLQKPPFEEAYILGETIEEGGRIRFSIKCHYDPDGPPAEPISEPMPWEIKAAALHPGGAADGGPGLRRPPDAAEIPGIEP